MSRVGDTAFALFHLALLVGLLGYAVWSLAAGAYERGGLILGVLALYYILVLHKPVVAEVRRRRERRRSGKR